MRSVVNLTPIAKFAFELHLLDLEPLFHEKSMERVFIDRAALARAASERAAT